MIPVPDPRMIFGRDLMRGGYAMHNRIHSPARGVSIDWTHPLSQGLASYVIDPSCDLVNNRRMLAYNIYNSGRGVVFKNENSELRYYPINVSDAFTATIVLPRMPDVSTRSSRTLWSFGRDATRIYGEVLAKINGNTLEVFFWNGRYIQQFNDSYGYFSGGGKGMALNIVIRFDPAQKMDGSTCGYPMGGAAPDGGTPHLDLATIGCDIRDHNSIDEFVVFVLHNRYLNDAEMHQMSRNPYQMLRRT